MNETIILTDEQRELVESNIEIVNTIICIYINANNNVSGLSDEDIYQEGCIALCKAAATYDGSTLFKTYAQVVVRNALYTYCSKMNRVYKRTLSYDAPLRRGSADTFADYIPDTNEDDKPMSLTELYKLLESVKTDYNGVTLKGIEAMELKLKGFSGKEIAAMYGVKQTHVGAWIARAVKKLRVNERFISTVA